MKRKTIKTSQLIFLVIAILVVIDFLFNESIILTKFSSKFIDFLMIVSKKFGEHITNAIK